MPIGVGLSQECWAENEFRNAPLGDMRLADGRPLAGGALDHGELRQLFATCAADAAPASFRNGAAIALLYATGLRRTFVSDLLKTDPTSRLSGVSPDMPTRSSPRAPPHATTAAAKACNGRP